MKILIVDDDINNLNVLLDIFNESPFSTLVATSGESALEKAISVFPDLILLDVMMAGMDGFETSRRLKSQAGTKDIPVIFMTALSETADKMKGFEAGCVDYVTKPFQHEEVIARVNTHLTIRKQKLELEKMIHELSQKNTLNHSNLEMARKIQSGMIPQQLIDKKLFKAKGLYQPMEELGGDFYDLSFDQENKLKFYISDVSGHGISSALIATLQKPLVDGYFQTDISPGETLANMSDMVHPYLEKEGYFFTAIYGSIDFGKMKMEYSIAAHPDFLILGKDLAVKELPAGKKDMLIGPFKGLEYRTLEEDIHPGDMIIFYTDGVIESMNQNLELYGMERLISTLKSNRPRGLEGMIDSVVHSVELFTNHSHREDDITLLLIEIL